VQVIDKDREGNPITLPERIETIITMGPSNTEVLVALGFANAIIATDEFSDNIGGLTPGIPMFCMMSPDGEQMINLMPDVMFVAGMTRVGGEDPFKAVSDAGVCVIYIPSSFSIAGIMEDIRFIAAVMGVQERGEEIIAVMDREIEAVRAIGDTITDRRTVYFEVSAAPWMVSFGRDTFLNEMIEIIGAVNVFADREGWMSVADEVALASDPDVILTSVNYLDDPIGEIKARPGWGGMTAVRNGAVYFIDTDASNRPSHNVVKALMEMARAVYPEFY
jgi:iron complex transport system substrate-binding protein